MTKAERDHVIDACIERVLSLRANRHLDFHSDAGVVETITGAACFRLLQLQSEPLAEPNCCWTEDEDGNWDTACGHIFIFDVLGPVENKMQFCCYCGQPLTAQPVEVEA